MEFLHSVADSQQTDHRANILLLQPTELAGEGLQTNERDKQQQNGGHKEQQIFTLKRWGYIYSGV